MVHSMLLCYDRLYNHITGEGKVYTEHSFLFEMEVQELKKKKVFWRCCWYTSKVFFLFHKAFLAKKSHPWTCTEPPNEFYWTIQFKDLQQTICCINQTIHRHEKSVWQPSGASRKIQKKDLNLKFHLGGNLKMQICWQKTFHLFHFWLSKTCIS